MAKRIFGRIKGMPRPKTDEDWSRLWSRHKILLPHITALQLFCSRHGPGHTGVRLFKADLLPPIEHWNKHIDVTYEKNFDKTVEVQPRVIAKLANGQEHEIQAEGMRAETILDRLKALGRDDGAARTERGTAAE